MSITEMIVWTLCLLCCAIVYAKHISCTTKPAHPTPPTVLSWQQVHDWFNIFYDEYVESKKLVRGRAFSGSHMEVWGDTVVIILHDPYARGEDTIKKL